MELCTSYPPPVHRLCTYDGSRSGHRDTVCHDVTNGVTAKKPHRDHGRSGRRACTTQAPWNTDPYWRVLVWGGG